MVKLLRPAAGEWLYGVLLGPLTMLKLHWVANATYPCWECERCPYCPGLPHQKKLNHYGAAAEFSTQLWTPSANDESQRRLRIMAGENPPPLRAVKIRNITGLALAEIPNGQYGVVNREPRGLIIEWAKGQYKQSPVKVSVVDVWQGPLLDEFDWMPAAQIILNNGQQFRFDASTIPDGSILQFPVRRQA